ncbi:MAG: Inositol-1-monophosphatase [Bacteroidetes bacterium MED-G17]|nr:MAG: Inositol-1-monophosphatase [Bacteroidetes bacterium MED-G17]
MQKAIEKILPKLHKVLNTYSRKSNEKSPYQLVTEIDIKVEQLLIEHLAKLLPEAGFITEEGQTQQGKMDGLTWIIDPIDGTSNMVFGIPFFCLSIGLVEAGKTILGFVHEFNHSDTFFAHFRGAQLNGENISVRKNTKINNVLAATGFPHGEVNNLDVYLEVLEHTIKETHSIRRLGTAAMDLCYTACGRFDGYFEMNLKPWDICGGAYIVEQAGGIVSDFKGEKNHLNTGNIIAGNPLVHRFWLNKLKDKF